MLSIIVAVHNQLGHNTLFLDGVRRFTTGPYEVIVVDNHSTDGSAEFFASHGCQVIRNSRNLCYPESMNLGFRQSKGDYLCLINNDLYVAPNWNGLLIEAMERHGLDAASPLGLEMMPSGSLTDWMQSRWAAIGQGRLSSGKTEQRLRTMLREMYGDWEQYCREVQRAFAQDLFEGIVGSCVMVRRSTFEKIGLLDERVQAADWDLYYTLRKRESTVGDVRRCMVVGGVFVHHFMRATLKGKREPFACDHPKVSIDDKWEKTEQAALWCKPAEFASGPPARGQHLKKRIFGPLKKLVREVDRALVWRWLFVNPEEIVARYRRQFQVLGTARAQTRGPHS